MNRKRARVRQIVTVIAVTVVAGARLFAQEPKQGEDDIFFENAFDEALVGERPASLMPGNVDRVGDDPTNPSMPSENVIGPRWSSRITAATLEDEIKSLNKTLIVALRSPSHYASGGNATASDAFGLLASWFAVVDGFDGEVRWKEQAASASHRFALAAQKLQRADADSYSIARAALEELRELLGGGEVARSASPQPDWADVANRSVLMRRLEIATEERLHAWLASDTALPRTDAPIGHESEIVAMLAELLVQEGMPDADDDAYREFAQELRVAAMELGTSATQHDFDSSGRAFSAIRATCERCHETYR